MWNSASKVWSFFEPLHDQIYSIIAALIVTFIIYVLRARTNIQWTLVANSFHTLKNEGDTTTTIYNEVLHINNLGRATANSVEIVFDGNPDSISVFPSIAHSRLINPDGNTLLHFKFLPPKTFLTVTFLSLNGSCKRINTVRCEETNGNFINTVIVKQLPAWVNNMISIAMILAIAFIFTLFINLLNLV